MSIIKCQVLLAETLAMTTCSAMEESPNGKTGRSVIHMASAYESDGKTFFSRGDKINALAAFLYGLGWLHCGIASGLLTAQGGRTECPFAGRFGQVPASQQEKLDEKTDRYAHLLTTALASVSPAPPAGTPSHAFALQVGFIAGLYLQQGRHQASEGRREEGLACFSYGHGWLDAGVQAGLFTIHAHREIFTVD